MSDLTKFIDKKEQEQSGFKERINREIEAIKIGEEIRAMRIASGMTQAELAEKLQTTKSAISRLENHSTSMRLSTIEKVAGVFDKKVVIHFQQICFCLKLIGFCVEMDWLIFIDVEDYT